MSVDICRIPNVARQTGMARATIYARVARGLFTKPVSIGPRSSGWPAAEIEALNRAKLAGYDEERTRRLVAWLHEQRARAADQLPV